MDGNKNAHTRYNSGDESWNCAESCVLSYKKPNAFYSSLNYKI